MPATAYTISDAPFEKFVPDSEVYLGDVVDRSHGHSMSVGWARYAAGASNDWTLTYDEALVVTKGTFTVRTPEGDSTAREGEVIFIAEGTPVTYHADTDAELVYVAHPHWR